MWEGIPATSLSRRGLPRYGKLLGEEGKARAEDAHRLLVNVEPDALRHVAGRKAGVDSATKVPIELKLWLLPGLTLEGTRAFRLCGGNRNPSSWQMP